MASIYRREEHIAISRALRSIRSDLFLACRCWFAGGTAIVMTHDEYRLSVDIGFLCSDRDGYRTLRQAVTARGAEGVFEGRVEALREFRCDRYGLRTVLDLGGRPVK